MILGQDPYHGRGQAEGWRFRWRQAWRCRRRLRNIFKELQRDLGDAVPPLSQPGGSLVRWARQGVLLLNTCLTVEEGQPASHAGKGWEVLTDAIIREVSQTVQPVGFHAVGCHAQSKRALIDASRPPGSDGQSSVAVVRAASAGAVYRLRAFFAGRAWREQHACAEPQSDWRRCAKDYIRG